MTRDFASGLPLIEIAELLIDNVPGYEDREPLELVEGGLDRSDALDELEDNDFFDEEKEIPKLKTEILSLVIDFYCRVDITSYDLGGVYVEREGRKYCWDIVSTSIENDGSRFVCQLEVDSETFPLGDEYPYTLTDEDLTQSSNLIVTAYIGCEFEVEPESVTLFVKKDGCTIALDGRWE